MKDFSIISEGVLSDVDSTLKASDKTVKSLKMQEDIKKNMWAINVMYNSSTYFPKQGQDKFKRDIKVGDVVMYMDQYSGPEFGIVTYINNDSNNEKNIRVTISEYMNGEQEKMYDDDIFNTCRSTMVNHKDIVILARKKDAERLLKILIKAI